MPAAVDMNGGLAVPSARTHEGASFGTTGSSFTLVNQSVSNEGDLSYISNDLEGKSLGEQIERLNSALETERKVKDGAENMLNMPLTEDLRAQVMSELASASKKIDALTRLIDQKRNASRKPSNDFAPNGRSKVAANGTPRSRRRELSPDKDDFRTALGHANSCMKTLRYLASPSVSSPPVSSPGSSSLTVSGNPAHVERARIEAMNRLVDVFQRNMRVRYEIKLQELVEVVTPALADRCSKLCRATAYRLIRHALVDADSVERLRELSLDWYIVKSLHRDNKHAVEKEQVIKLIRTIVEVGSTRHETYTAAGLGSVPLSEPVMRAFIAVAEHAEDPFRLICVQTLTEILLIDIDLVAKSGGIRLLLHVLGEGPPELGSILASAFLHIIDLPRTRAYLHIGTDLEIAISAVTDAYGRGPDNADRMRGCCRVIQLMLKTWSGLMYLCMDDMAAIRSIVNTLGIPSLETREIVLDMFFDLFNIKTPDWYQTFIDGRRLTMYRRSRQLSVKHDQAADERPPELLKLTDQYIALLVLVCTHSGLLEVLTGMLEEVATGTNLSRKATLLMAEVLQMANRVLPLNVAAKIQAIPRLFDLAADYDHGQHRIVGTQAFSAIDSFNRNRTKLGPTTVKNYRPRANSVEDAVRRGQRQREQVKLKMGMQMDDKTFQASLIETQVMLTKDHTKWNFDALQELVEGPLLNPKRMEEAIKVSRLIRRLMSFFHPFSHRFSDIDRRVKANSRWVRLGCTLLTTLMSTPEGLRFLTSEDDFLKQIVEGFAQLDPFNGKPDSDPMFSKRRMAETLTSGYFEMLGTLSKRKEGMELLEKSKVFTAFYHLSELRSREDLIKGIIENLDYSFDGHPRIVLSKALTSSYKHVRLFATNHLGGLIRESTNANAWTMRLLLTQLYDPAPEVCEKAVQFVDEACETMEILKLVVEMQPVVDHLGEIGHPLLLKFMSTPLGFRYLYDAGYIDREMDFWFHERNLLYVIQIETFLTRVFNSNPADHEEHRLAFDGHVPTHFYGEMSKTELGCQVLQEKGHFGEFVDFIRQHGLESEDTDLILKLKSILWAVGSIGASAGGLHFLEEEEITPEIVQIAEHSSVPSVRGTCFFVLGLISTTSQGAELLDDYQWEASLSPLGSPTGICVPGDIEKFTSIPQWCPVPLCSDLQNRLAPPSSQPEVEVITAIQNLANTVIANAASRTLAKLKSMAEYRPVFSSPSTFYRALHIISYQRYRLPVRRYIIDLFDVELNQDTIRLLNEAEKSLRAPQSPKVQKAPSNRVVSMFGPMGRPRRGTDSDDEDDLVVPDPSKVTPERPPTILRPVSVIKGFDA